MQPDTSSQEQLQIYTNWANYYLRKTGHSPTVKNLQTDLKGGVLLARIIEAVFESNIPGIIYDPSHQAQELDNLSACLDFIRDRGVTLDDVTDSDIHTGSLDAIFALFYALSVHRQKIKAASMKPQTSTPFHSADTQFQESRATPPSVPPKSKKIPNSESDSVTTRLDIRSFGYKESVRKSSLEDSESAPVSRGGSLDRKALREDRYAGRVGDSFSEELQGRRRYGLSGSLTPQNDGKKSSSWLSVREAGRLSDNKRASKNLSVRELVAFLEKGEIPPDSNEGKKLPAVPPKPRPGRLESEDEIFSFQPISVPDSGAIEMRHSSTREESSQVGLFSSKFLPTDPVCHEYSLPATPPPTSNTSNTMDFTAAVARPALESAHRDGPPLPPRNPSMRPGTSYSMRRGESFLSDDRFTTVSLLTEHEPPAEPESIPTVTLGPTHVTTCLVNSDRLPSPKMTQTVSLSPQTGTTESDLSSPDPVHAFQASPLVRGILERSPEDKLDRSGKGGLVGWATKSFRKMSTPKQSNRKKLPIPDSPTSPHFKSHGLKRASSEWNNRTPKNKTNPSQVQEEEMRPSTIHRSVSMSESLDRRPKILELGPSSSDYRPALPVRRPVGEKPLSQEIQELLEGFDITLSPRPVVRDGESPSNLYANLGEDRKTEHQRATPVTLDTVSIPATVVSDYSEEPAKRDAVYKRLLFAQDQLARQGEELRELRGRIQFMEQAPILDPLTPVSSGLQTDGQSSEKKKRSKRRWLLGRKGHKGELELDADRFSIHKELERLRHENSYLREENARLKGGYVHRERDTPNDIMSPVGESVTSSTPTDGGSMQICLFVLTRDHHDMTQERLIGAGKLELTPNQLTWERLDREVVSGFMSHLKSLDNNYLGLEEDVLSAYLLGKIRRQLGARQIGSEGPLEILREMPRPNILMDLRALSLSNLSYQLLIPLRILQQYVDILLRQRRILVLGPPGTGKTHLVESLGQYACLVSAPRVSRSAYKLFSVGKMSLHSIMQSLSMTLKLESAKGKVFVFDGVKSSADLDKICSLLLSEKSDPPHAHSPYILATLRSDQTDGLKPVLLQHGLWVVSYLWHREPVLGILGRILRQKLLHLQLSSSDNSALSQLSVEMVDWLPATLEKINNFIESTYSSSAVFGPGIFLKCPLAGSPQQIELWFSQTLEEYIFPYLRQIAGNSLKQDISLTEFMQQVLRTCPIKFLSEQSHKLASSIVESEL
ncbi:Neuron navigator 3-like [Oopsacas minuta]|uniref:Neuron navigator 3-like n=1 Tax=Oopsacas minuta TaxID=111878 RepID=A0AAV7KA36_9METZ|nr:Neuron navigator 3-like [Oopsacas minuta]